MNTQNTTREELLEFLADILSEDTPETQNRSSVTAIEELIEGTLNHYLETSTFPTPKEVRTLLMLNRLKQELE